MKFRRVSSRLTVFVLVTGMLVSIGGPANAEDPSCLSDVPVNPNCMFGRSVIDTGYIPQGPWCDVVQCPPPINCHVGYPEVSDLEANAYGLVTVVEAAVKGYGSCSDYTNIAGVVGIHAERGGHSAGDTDGNTSTTLLWVDSQDRVDGEGYAESVQTFPGTQDCFTMHNTGHFGGEQPRDLKQSRACF